MDGVSLLDEARAAGIDLRIDGERLVVRGPRSAEAMARRLLARKSEVMALMAHDDAPPGSAPVRYLPPAGCLGPTACARLGPCARHAAARCAVAGEPAGDHPPALPDTPDQLDFDPDGDLWIEETARAILDLSPEDLADYRAQVAAAPADDPYAAHDGAALALADRHRAVGRPTDARP